MFHVFGLFCKSGVFFYAKHSKCDFFQKSIVYLGHLIMEHGIEIEPSHIEKVKLWPIPRNIRELRSFLGFVGILPLNPTSPLER